MVHSFMGACAPGLRAWGCTDVLSRTFPLQQLTLCFMVFFFFMFCLFFENERRAGEMIFMIFFFFFYYL